MPFTFSQFLVFSCFMVTLLVGRVMTSPVMRQKRSDDGDPLEPVVAQLSQQVNSLNAKLAALETKTAAMDKTVVFQAWTDRNALEVAGRGIIILRDVVINVGDAYSPLTGAFTVPISGIYSFQATVVAENNAVIGALFVDNKRVASSMSNNVNGRRDQASMNYVGHVNAGQKVLLKNDHGYTSTYHGSPGNPYTSFSGVLVKAD